MPRPDHPVLAASRRRAWILTAALSAGALATALWLASSADALPAQLTPVMSVAERVLAALVAAGLGVYALAATRVASDAAQQRRWLLCGLMAATAVVQVLLAILALSCALPVAA